MARVKAPGTSMEQPVKMAPALTPEARENQLVFLATELAEKKLLDGTASPQIIVHYLKLGTMEKKLELERLKKENSLLDAKTEALKSAKKVEELYDEAIKAMRRYSRHGDMDD